MCYHNYMRELEKILLSVEDEYLRVDIRWISRGYAFAKVGDKWDAVHRHIMGKADGLEIDHINRNKLDNRRENLRFITHQENLRNRQGWGKFPKGIYYDKSTTRTRPYKAQRRINGKIVSYGYHRTVDDAVEALKEMKRGI